MQNIILLQVEVEFDQSVDPDKVRRAVDAALEYKIDDELTHAGLPVCQWVSARLKRKHMAERAADLVDRALAKADAIISSARSGGE